jgi:excisionase family DNA binding protein
MAGLSDLGDKVLADLMRKSIRSGSVGESGLGSAPALTEKAVVPIGDDLQGYLRGLHRWLDSSEVADLLHYKVETVYRRIKCEGLPAHKDGRQWKFDSAEVAQWIEKRNGIPNMIRPPMRADNTLQVYYGKSEE